MSFYDLSMEKVKKKHSVFKYNVLLLLNSDEIQMLSMKRDFLEQNVELLRDQQFPGVVQFAEMETLKILKNDALARLERRKDRLKKLKNLYSLAVMHGHVYVDLLCMLMEMQFCSLREVAEFIADAHHYITTEYKLSSTRCVSFLIILMEMIICIIHMRNMNEMCRKSCNNNKTNMQPS